MKKIEEVIKKAYSMSPSEDLLLINKRIASMEKKIGYDFVTINKKLKSGLMSETMDICQLLMDIELRDILAKRAA